MSLQVEPSAADAAFTRYVVTAAKLVAPCVAAGDADAGFQWCLDELSRASLPHLLDDVRMAKSAHCLASGQTQRAIDVLLEFEQHSGPARAKAAANLSFLHLSAGNSAEAERYAVQAKEQDEYHVQVHLLHTSFGNRPAQ